jgi:leucyl-tRNA---protein transferase
MAQDQSPQCAYPAIAPPVEVPLVTLAEHACPYLPGRVAQSRGLLAGKVDPGIYHDFMDVGFRRSGRLIYQPVCRGCRACLPIRVPVGEFQESKSQRRSWRRNGDLAIAVGRPNATEEKFQLYARYQARWHGTGEPAEWENFVGFLYESPVETIEFCYRDRENGKLLAVGICDVSARSLSSVYFYFDPEQAWRGLGTFGALVEIQWAREREIPHYYLGYWVAGCASMEYKNRFRPFEMLHPDGMWRRDVGASAG